MEDLSNTRRKEPRYPLEAHAVVERDNGDTVYASTINVSGSGVLLDLRPAPKLNLGEEVRCGIELYTGKPPQPWGVGKVIRLEKSRVALEFSAEPPSGSHSR